MHWTLFVPSLHFLLFCWVKAILIYTNFWPFLPATYLKLIKFSASAKLALSLSWVLWNNSGSLIQPIFRFLFWVGLICPLMLQWVGNSPFNVWPGYFIHEMFSFITACTKLGNVTLAQRSLGFSSCRLSGFVPVHLSRGFKELFCFLKKHDQAPLYFLWWMMSITLYSDATSASPIRVCTNAY